MLVSDQTPSGLALCLTSVTAGRIVFSFPAFPLCGRRRRRPLKTRAYRVQRLSSRQTHREVLCTRNIFTRETSTTRERRTRFEVTRPPSPHPFQRVEHNIVNRYFLLRHTFYAPVVGFGTICFFFSPLSLRTRLSVRNVYRVFVCTVVYAVAGVSAFDDGGTLVF